MEKISGRAPHITPRNMSELVLFLLALEAYAVLKGGEDQHLKSAAPILLRYGKLSDEGFSRYFDPIIEGDPSFKRFKPDLRATRIGSVADRAIAQGVFLRNFLPFLRTRSSLMDTTFSDKAATAAIQRAALAASEDDPAVVLRKVSLVPTAAKLKVLREWIKESVRRADVQPEMAEEVLSDSNTSTQIGEDLRQVEAALAQVEPMSESGAALQAERQEIIDRIDEVAESSAIPATVFTAAAAAAAAEPRIYQTQTGSDRKLNPDKEAAMMIRGRGIIAAGAGAGKTMTLASKVVYHINELGVPAGSVVATSFSRKSAAELRRRIDKYGGTIEDREASGFGTTHSVAAKLMRQYDRGGREGFKFSSDQDKVIRLAMEQVQMTGGGEVPAAVSLFAGLTGSVPTPAEVDSLDSTPGIGLTFKEALDEAYKNKGRLDYKTQGFIDGFFNRRDRWYRAKMKNTKNLTDPRGLSGPQLRWLDSAFRQAGVDYDVYDPENKDPNLSGTARYAAKKRDKDKGMREKYPTFTKPVGQWFNQGMRLTRGEGDDEKPIPLGEFSGTITRLKGRLVSPTEAWHSGVVEKTHAAVYAAYEYLKGPKGETDFRNRGDFDDVLIDASKMMLRNPKVRKQIQSRFKVLLIDEAQDLNRAQHVMFGLMAGYLDPDKLDQVGQAEKISELAREDGQMTADTYCFIGDDKQCVDVDALVDTPSGTCRAGDLKVGDKVLSNRNGKVVAQTVRHVVPSQWAEGFRITTESGNTLLMSPNHRLWASEPRTEDHQMIVYLMYRKDMGFRVGVTNKGKIGSDGDYLNSFGGRAFLEKAERLWVIEVCESREDALLEETRISLRYGIPTTVFNGEHRDINQDRIEALFHEFGMNGSRLLVDRDLSLMYPHWMSQSYTKHGRERHTINLIAHSASNTQVSMEWSNEKFDGVLDGMGVRKTKGGRSRLRRWFANYREGLDFAEEVSRLTEAQISYRLSTPDGPLREITASGLFVGMQVPVRDGDAITTDAIVSIEKTEGVFVDLDVDDASNFFAGGILTHNSIYEFRGADPEAFIDMSDLVEGGAGFTTHVLETNYRSGKEIVEAANRLIAYNKKQIPMVCKANPERLDAGGVKTIRFAPAPPRDYSAAATWVAEHIVEQMELGVESGGEGSQSYDSFGVGLRTNAEAMAYGVEMIKKGIPFRSKINFFRDSATKALLGWLTIADEGMDGDNNSINEAVMKVTNTPVNMLGKKFKDSLTERATGNYIEWLEQNGDTIYGSRSKYTEYVENFTDNLRQIADLKGQDLTSEQILGEVLDLQGYDGTGIKDTLIDRVRGDEERMSALIAASPDGAVSEEELIEEALAPISPLKGLLDARGDLTEAMRYVRKLESANQKLAKTDDPNRGPIEPAVTLGTMHSWKGLEVPTMYIPMVGGGFPRFDKVADEDELASERRLAYVAVTRAEDNAYVLDIPTARQTKRGIVIQTSQFVGELCAPELSSEGRVATLTQEELEALDEDEVQRLSDELDAQAESYFEEKERPKRALMASWGGLLYTKGG